MRSKQAVLKDYFILINEEKGLKYTLEQIDEKIGDPAECAVIEKLLLEELYLVKEVEGVIISKLRAFYIFCKIVIHTDVRSGRTIWNSFIEKLFKNVEVNRQTCYMAHRGCFTADTVVLDRYGVARKIIDMPNAWSTGVQDVYRVLFNNGRNVKCTIAHPFYTDKGFKQLNKIDIKQDKVALLGAFSGTELVKTSSEFAKLLGYLNTDGYLNNAIKKKQSIKFTNTNLKMLEEVRVLVKHLFPTLNIKEYVKGNGKDLLLTSPDCKNPLREVIKKLNYDNNFPLDVFNWSDKNIALFLNRVFSCDGCVHNTVQPNGSKTSEINLATGINETYAKYYQLLLLRLGINANLIIHKRKDHLHTQYDLRIYSRPIIKKFFDIIGFVYGKEEQSKIAYERTKLPKHKFYSYKEPVMFIPDKSDGERMYWGNILKIEHISAEEVYDIEVPDKGWFVADGVMVHNSGKSYFLELYVAFKMFLLPYFDVCYSTNTPKQKRRWMKGFRSLIDDNEFLLGKKNKRRVTNREIPWGQEEVEYNDGVLEATTVGTTPRGGHYNLVIGDDPLREDNKYPMERIIDYYQGVLKPTTYTKKARYVIAGTPQSDDDLFHTLMNDVLDKHNRPIGKIALNAISSAGFHSSVYPAILNHKTKEVLVPEIWTYDQLMEERKKIGDIRFSREMMVSCKSYRNSLISASLFRSCSDSSLHLLQKGEQGKTYIIVVDSATSDAPTADYCAMSVFEDTGKGLIFRHLVHEKGFPVTDPEGFDNDQIHRLYSIWRSFNKGLVIIEKNNAGIALIQGVQAMCAKLNESIDIIEHYTHMSATGRATIKAGKANDIIDYIEYGLKGGGVIFPCDPDDIYTIDAFEKIKNEHLNFGVKKGKSGEVYEAIAGKDDIYDTCYLAWKYRGDQADTLPLAITMAGFG